MVCQVSLNLTYEGASGAIATPSTVYASADPYVWTGSAPIMPCIAPGEVGSFYTNAFAATNADLSAITLIQVAFHPNTYPGTSLAADAPLVTSTPAPIVGAYGLTGTFTGEVDTVNNIGLDAYPRDATGLVLGQITADDLGTLTAGATYSFSTDTVSTPFTQYRQFVDYITGVAQTPQVRAGEIGARGEVAAARAIEVARWASFRDPALRKGLARQER